MSIFDKVEQYITDNNMILPGDCITVGVSGGADSMCLLFLLQKYCQKHKLKDGDILLQAVHVHHGIRGEFADRDADFVRDYCEKADVPYIIKKVNAPMEAKLRRESLEEAARNLRYGAFRECALSSSKRNIIAVAGHMNDQAETIIHNIIRGTGIRGLSAMKPVDGDIIRPFLCVSREEIEEMAGEFDIPFITDETNQDVGYTRNRIRHNILPEAKIINPRAVENISRMSEKLSRVERLIERLSEEACEIYVTSENNEIILDTKVFLEDEIIACEVVRCCIKRIAGRLKDITSEHIDSIVELSQKQSGKIINLPYGVNVSRQFDRLVFFKKNENADKALDPMAGITTKILEKSDFEGLSYPVDTYTKWFDYDKINNGLTVRTRRPGDYIRLGCGKKKLKDYFINQKVDERKRDKIMLVADGDEIIWIVGYRISEFYKVTKGTQRVIEISISKETGYEGQDQSNDI